MFKKLSVKVSLKPLFLVCTLILTTLITTNAFAEKVVFEDVSFLFGTDGTNNAFNITQAGTYQATLVDFDFPYSFNNLSMNITKGATVPVDQLNGEGSLIFDATPGLYFANVFGNADDAQVTASAGLYGLKIAQLSLSAVPLPTAIGMFASALLMYVGFGSAGKRISKNGSQQNGLTDAVVVA